MLHAPNWQLLLFSELAPGPCRLGGVGVGAAEVDHPVSVVDLGATLLGLAVWDSSPEARLLPQRSGEGPSAGCPVVVTGTDSCALVQDHWKLIVRTDRAQIALYDLSADPGELVNRVEDERSVAQDLLRRLNDSGCPYDLSPLAL